MQIAEARNQLLEHPLDAHALYQLGLTYMEKGQLDRAIEFVSQALASDSTVAAFHSSMGDLLRKSGQPVEAACAYRQALQTDPEYLAALSGLGNLYVDRHEADLAAGYLRKAVALAPQSPDALCHLARALNHSRAFAEAATHAERAIALNPDCAAAYLDFAAARVGDGNFTAALQALERLIQRQPNCADAYGLTAQILNNLNFDSRALANCQKALSLEPEHPGAHFELATYALATQDWQTGWREYEWRFQMPGQQTDHIRFVQPLTEPTWKGENLEGKALFVHADQGLGDTVQCIRFLPEVARRNCRLIVLVQPQLLRLLQCFHSIATILPFLSRIPRHDYQISLCSLPGILGTTLQTIPHQVPYITLPADRDSIGLPKSSSKLRVGLVWATRPLSYTDQRSVPLSFLELLFDLESVAFYSLQINHNSQELDSYRNGRDIHDLKPLIRDMRDTALLVSQLDIIISIDTSIAHLAGALGKEVWVLLPFASSWRWLKSDSDWRHASPWYPTMRLFRSARFGDWQSVISEVKLELERRLQSQPDVPVLPAGRNIHSTREPVCEEHC